MATTSKLPLGTILLFTGYTDLAPGMKPLLDAGMTVKVIGYGENGAVQVQSVADETLADTLFPEEFTVSEEGEAEAVNGPGENALAGVTFDPNATIAELRKVATDNEQKAAGRTKADVIASLEAMGATAVEAETEMSEAPVEVEVETTGKQIAPTLATPEKQNIEITDSERVQALLEAQDALAAAKALSQQAEEAFFSLGGVLSHVHDEDLHKTIVDEDGNAKYDGKQGFADYAFNELNVNYRKAMHLIAIYRKFRELGLDETRAIQIGWTKLREMVSVLNEKNADDLLAYGTEHTRDEIVDYVKVTYVNDSDTPVTKVKKTRLTFNLFAENAEIVQGALAAAQELGDVPTPEQALALICAEWGQLTGNVEVTLPDAIAALEARYGVQLGVREGAERTSKEELEDA